MATASELSIQTVREGVDATDMANAIFGAGVTVVSASYRGDRDSAGIYTNADTIIPGVGPSDTGVILSTGEAEDFTNSSGEANQANATSTNTSGVNNNSLFNAAAGARTFDASFLDVDFIPVTNLMTMQFVFSSEEYPEFQNSVYQDFVGVWVNGSQVDVDVGNGDADPGNINTTNNINMFVDNTNDSFNTEMDGFTITMTVTMNVIPGVVNSMRVGIADVADSNYDSNLVIAGDSIPTAIVAVTDAIDMFPSGTKTLDVLANDVPSTPGTLTVTHINGQPVTAGSTITLPTGQQVTLNANGTLEVVGDGDAEDFNFTYGVTDGTNTDVGFVNATSIPCFVAGTLIDTPDGAKAVEALVPGDLVVTQDDGPQPLRWIGTRTVAAEGDFAPIRIAADTFGHHGDVMVSPLHRVLIRDRLAELLFGDAEVLIAARDLIDGRNVVQNTGGQVTYVHLMFDRHQVVFSDGLASESFLPGPQTTKSFERATIAEICAVFPHLDPETGEGYGSAARRTLRRFEADLLLKSTIKAA